MAEHTRAQIDDLDGKRRALLKKLQTIAARMTTKQRELDALHREWTAVYARAREASNAQAELMSAANDIVRPHA